MSDLVTTSEEMPASAAQASQPLPVLSTDLTEPELRARLDAASRRGRLPGYHPGNNGTTFTLTDFGRPFEGVLEGRYEQSPAGRGGSIRFSTRLKPVMPWVMFIVLVLTVWPGVWITDSMLKTYFSWYEIETWWWYIPLTALPIPWIMRSALRKSRQSVDAEARELVEKVAAALKA